MLCKIDYGLILLMSHVIFYVIYVLLPGSMNLRNLHNESYIAIYEEGNCKAHGIDGACNIFVKKVSSRGFNSSGSCKF